MDRHIWNKLTPVQKDALEVLGQDVAWALHGELVIAIPSRRDATPLLIDPREGFIIAGWQVGYPRNATTRCD